MLEKIPINAVYCGMAYDIAIIESLGDFDTLFAMCNLDAAYSLDGTWNGVKKLITNFLVTGRNSLARYRENITITPGIIVSESETIIGDEVDFFGTKLTPTKWTLVFDYKGKRRQLIYYNQFNYEKNEWPEEIKNNSYLITIGASFQENDMLCKMLLERMESRFIYFGCWWPQVVYEQVYEIHCCEKTGNARFIVSVFTLKLIFNCIGSFTVDRDSEEKIQFRSIFASKINRD